LLETRSIGGILRVRRLWDTNGCYWLRCHPWKLGGNHDVDRCLRMVLGVGGVFIAVGIDAAVAVANGGCIDDNDDDDVVGVGAYGEFETGGRR